MAKDCKLIATLPNLNDEKSINEMLKIEDINEFRFNSGTNQLMSNEEIIKRLKAIEKLTNKKVWIDLKGRQLKITLWADPNYETIELNHSIDIEYPAYVIFKDGTYSEIIRCKGNKILLKNSPYRALGKGQSINIFAKNLEIKGYLTQDDKQLIELSKKYEMNNYMASFIESMSDLEEILSFNSNANIISKIESIKGIEFALKTPINLPLLAAREDLYVALKFQYETILYLKKIIEKDKKAICASKIFSSLDNSNEISLSDYEDLELMYMYGYRNFMLQDDLKDKKLLKSINGWRTFINE